MEELMSAIQAETSMAVQIWIRWMLFIFLCSIIFVWKHVPARFVLGAFILGNIIVNVIFKVTGSPQLIGISHLLVWVPLAIYLYLKVIKSETFKLKSPYGIWIAVLMTTIVVAVAFDIRDFVLIAMGQK